MPPTTNNAHSTAVTLQKALQTRPTRLRECPQSRLPDLPRVQKNIRGREFVCLPRRDHVGLYVTGRQSRQPDDQLHQAPDRQRSISGNNEARHQTHDHDSEGSGNHQPETSRESQAVDPRAVLPATDPPRRPDRPSDPVSGSSRIWDTRCQASRLRIHTASIRGQLSGWGRFAPGESGCVAVLISPGPVGIRLVLMVFPPRTIGRNHRIIANSTRFTHDFTTHCDDYAGHV